MQKLRWLVLALLAIAALAAAGCGGDDDDNGGDGGGGKASGEPIKVGASLPLTGETNRWSCIRMFTSTRHCSTRDRRSSINFRLRSATAGYR